MRGDQVVEVAATAEAAWALQERVEHGGRDEPLADIGSFRRLAAYQWKPKPRSLMSL